ncbi:MAG TPA: hypothetical protein VLB75_10025 [Steroidobacteraceae bacterium]|nr:hypothetical protein [Steroidobacteraceae bacterium]
MEKDTQPTRSETVAELATLNRMLQQLHSHILDVERQSNPGLTGAALLDRLLNDPGWAWLRGLSALMADIDHVLAQNEPPSESDRAVAAAHIRGLLFGQGDLSNEQFLGRYRPLLQLNPSLASVHGELKGLLNRQPAEPENESERLHARHQWAIRCRYRSGTGAGRA